MTGVPHIDFAAINAAAASDRLALLRKWFPNGRLNGNEFEVGDLQGNKGRSLKINAQTGVWCDFNTGDRGGDMIGLYAAIHRIKQGEAAKQLAAEMGLATANDNPGPRPVSKGNSGSNGKPAGTGKKPEWTPVLPVPGDALEPQFRHARYKDMAAKWAYRDAGGRLLGYICRFDRSGGGKDILPHVYCRSSNGRAEWRWLSFPKPRPIYGLDALAVNATANVIIVEGEKAVEAGRRLVPESVVITWPGGSKAIKHTDWSVLKGRKVLIIPDADEAGLAAAEGCVDDYGVHKPGIAQMLEGIAAGVRVVDPPDGVADGWDIADALAEGWTPEQTRAFIKDRLREPRTPEPAPDTAPENPPEPNGVDDYGLDGGNEGPFAAHADFKPLGHSKGNFYFLGSRGRQVIEASGRGLRDKGLLFQLAPMHYWEREFPGENGFAGNAVDRAANALINVCYRAGLFSPDRLRGRGAWWDDGRSVLHLGDRLVVDGAETDIDGIDGRYIYEQAPAVRSALDNHLGTKEAHQLQELCESLMWEKPVYATLLAGWCVVAPICGALNWRPHIWLTSPAGGGKSWLMDNIIRRCLGDTALVVQSLTSEAGIRQTLGSDARPVVFDEAESETRRAASNMEGIMGLMTQASSDGGQIVKGSTSGQARSFSIRSCFAFASINIGFDAKAHTSRMAVLTLIKDNSPEAARHFVETVKPMASRLLTPEYCARLQARAVRYLPVIRRNAQVFGEAAAEYLGDRRLGDLLGAMLAGSYLLHSINEIDLDTAREWVLQRDWTEQADVAAESDEMMLLNTIMDCILRIEMSGGAQTRSIGELVSIVLTGFPQASGERIDPETAHKHLKRIGVKIDEEIVFIANTHSGIKKILRESRWAKNWNRTLMRIDGAVATTSTMFFSGSSHRAVGLPAGAFFKEKCRN
ncbi:MAG: hypothetical protein GY835_09325 [bacterium]|nr:hypothetical protein [bacterium]